MDGDKDAERKPGPVVDNAEESQREHRARQAQHPHKLGELQDPGNKTHKEHDAHEEIYPPFDDLHIHRTSIRSGTSLMQRSIMEVAEQAITHFLMDIRGIHKRPGGP